MHRDCFRVVAIKVSSGIIYLSTDRMNLSENKIRTNQNKQDDNQYNKMVQTLTDKFDSARKKFSNKHGDHISLLKMYEKYKYYFNNKHIFINILIVYFQLDLSDENNYIFKRYTCKNKIWSKIHINR